MTAEPVARLAAQASAASQKLGETLTQVRARTAPDALFDEAYEMAADQAQKLVTKTRETVSAHPVAIGAAVAAIGLALLARNTLAKATVDLGDDGADYTDYDDSYEESPIEAPAPEAPEAQNPLISAIIGLATGAVISLLTTKNG